MSFLQKSQPQICYLIDKHKSSRKHQFWSHFEWILSQYDSSEDVYSVQSLSIQTSSYGALPRIQEISQNGKYDLLKEPFSGKMLIRLELSHDLLF